MYSVQGLHLCLFCPQVKLFWLISLLQQFQYILQLIYQLIFPALAFFIVKIFTNIARFVMFTFTITRILNKTPYCIQLYQSILYIHTCIYHHSSVVYCYKHCHIICICTHPFQANLWVLFH